MAFQFNLQSLLTLATGFPFPSLAAMHKYRFYTREAEDCLRLQNNHTQVLPFPEAKSVSSWPSWMPSWSLQTLHCEWDKPWSASALGAGVCKEHELATLLHALPVDSVGLLCSCESLGQRLPPPLENFCSPASQFPTGNSSHWELISAKPCS